MKDNHLKLLNLLRLDQEYCSKDPATGAPIKKKESAFTIAQNLWFDSIKKGIPLNQLHRRIQDFAKDFFYKIQSEHKIKPIQIEDKSFLLCEGVLISPSDHQSFGQFTFTLNLPSPGNFQFGKMLQESFMAYTALKAQPVITGRGNLLSKIEDHWVLFFRMSQTKILRVDGNEISVIDNGYNSDNVFLVGTEEWVDFNYIPSSSQFTKDFLENLITKSLATNPLEKKLIISHGISAFLLELISDDRIIMKYEGPTATGKTKAAEIVSAITLGKEYTVHPTGASAFSKSSKISLYVMDNQEQEDLDKEKKQFLLMSSSGGNKEKRKSDSDSDIVTEEVKSLVILTGIQPFDIPELRNRTMVINFDRKNMKKGYRHKDILGDIRKNRDQLFSGIAEILGSIIQNRLADAEMYSKLFCDSMRCPGFQRLMGHFSLLLDICGEMFPDSQLQEIKSKIAENKIEKSLFDFITGWITNEDLKDQIVEDVAISALDGFVKQAIYDRSQVADVKPTQYPEIDFNFDIIRDPKMNIDGHLVKIVGTPENLFITLSRYAVKSGLKEWQNITSRSFGAHLSTKHLKDANWTKTPFKTVQGKRFYCWIKNFPSMISQDELLTNDKNETGQPKDIDDFFETANATKQKIEVMEGIVDDDF